MPGDYVKPIPEPGPDSRGFWEGCRAHELRILRCRRCGTYVRIRKAIARAATLLKEGGTR